MGRGWNGASWDQTGARDAVEVVLWDVAEQKQKTALEGHTGSSLQGSRDGKLLATAGRTDRTVLIWDTSNNAGSPHD